MLKRHKRLSENVCKYESKKILELSKDEIR